MNLCIENITQVSHYLNIKVLSVKVQQFWVKQNVKLVEAKEHSKAKATFIL